MWWYFIFELDIVGSCKLKLTWNGWFSLHHLFIYHYYTAHIWMLIIPVRPRLHYMTLPVWSRWLLVRISFSISELLKHKVLRLLDNSLLLNCFIVKDLLFCGKWVLSACWVLQSRIISLLRCTFTPLLLWSLICWLLANLHNISLPSRLSRPIFLLLHTQLAC